MKVTARTNTLTPTGDNIQAQLNTIGRILSGNTSFGSTMSNTDGEQNLELWKVSGTTPGVANTEFSVNHGLNRVPFFYIAILSKAGDIYQLPGTGTAWTITKIFVKSDVASADFDMLIF